MNEHVIVSDLPFPFLSVFLTYFSVSKKMLTCPCWEFLLLLSFYWVSGLSNMAGFLNVQHPNCSLTLRWMLIRSLLFCLPSVEIIPEYVELAGSQMTASSPTRACSRLLLRKLLIFWSHEKGCCVFPAEFPPKQTNVHSEPPPLTVYWPDSWVDPGDASAPMRPCNVS